MTMNDAFNPVVGMAMMNAGGNAVGSDS